VSEIRLNRLPPETGAPADNDRLISIPAAAFTTGGTTEDRESVAEANPPETWTFESLRAYFQQGIQADVETGETIVTKLSELASGSRLSYNHLDDTPVIPVLRTADETATLLGTLTGDARLDASAIKNLPQPQDGGLVSVHTDASLSGLGTTASPLAVAYPFTQILNTKLDGIEDGATADQTGEEIVTSLSALTGDARLSYTALKDAPSFTTDDNDVDEFQFAVATVSQGLDSNDALANTAAGESNTADLAFGSTRDTASLGFTDESGRLSFANTHTDRDTNLIITGRVPIQHSGLGGRLRVYFREYLATLPDNVNREVVVADHPITESASTRTFHFPVTGTQVRVRRGRTYKVEVEFSAEAGTAANGEVAIVYTLTDNANLIAFNRFQLRLTDLIDTPLSLGSAGQVLAVSSGGNQLEFVDESGAQTPAELFATLREADALTALADADSLFGWDASSSQGAEMSLSTLRAYMQEGVETGAHAFTELSDTPSALGSAGQIPAVNNDGTALEFVDASTDGTFHQVESLPAAVSFGQTADLIHLDAINHAPPGLYSTVNNPIANRNRTMVTIGADPIASNVFGASINPAGPFGHIDDASVVGQIAWSTAVPRYVNVALNTAFTGNRTILYLDFGSSEFSRDITRRLRFNRGTTTGNFTVGGRTYRNWTVDTTEHDQSSDEVVQRLIELQDAPGDNDITIDVYTSASGDTPLNHLPAYIWQSLTGQAALKHHIEESDADNRILLASEIFADNNTLKTYDTVDLLNADIGNRRDGEMVRVRNNTPGTSDANSRLFVINGAVAGTNGTRGAVSHRNRFSAALFAMGDGDGFYWTLARRDRKRVFNNVSNAADIDPDGRIVWVSFYDSGGEGNRPYIQLGLDPALTVANTVAVLLMNRVTATDTAAPQLDVVMTRTGTTGTFGGKTGNAYQYTLNAMQASMLGTAGWLFDSDELVFDLRTAIGVSGVDINFNPDEIQFTAGTGYAGHTDAVAASTTELSVVTS